MSEEIASLFVSIGADSSGLVLALDELDGRLSLFSGQEGPLGALALSLPQGMQDMMSGVELALAPLPQVLQTQLRGPVEAVLSELRATIRAQIAAMLGELQNAWALINSGGIGGGATGGSSGGQGDLPGRAEGGQVLGGAAYWVGEAGPEVFIPHSTGSIIPNHHLSAGGGPGVQINGPIHVYGVQDVEGLLDQLQAEARRRGH
jgi:hypothetical protein